MNGAKGRGSFQRIPVSKRTLVITYPPGGTTTVAATGRGSAAPFRLAGRNWYVPGGNGIRNTPSWSVVTLATVAPDAGSTTLIRAGQGLSPHRPPTTLTGQPPSTTLTPVTPDPLGGLGGTGTGLGDSGRVGLVAEAAGLVDGATGPVGCLPAAHPASSRTASTTPTRRMSVGRIRGGRRFPR